MHGLTGLGSHQGSRLLRLDARQADLLVRGTTFLFSGA